MLVYALGSQRRLRDPARSILGAVSDGTLAATTTIEVIQELLHVRARRRTRSDAAGLARRLALGLAPLIQPDDSDLDLGISLFESVPELGAFDAVLAAVTRQRRWTLVSADRAFTRVDGLDFVDLATADLLGELHTRR